MTLILITAAVLIIAMFVMSQISKNKKKQKPIDLQETLISQPDVHEEIATLAEQIRSRKQSANQNTQKRPAQKKKSAKAVAPKKLDKPKKTTATKKVVITKKKGSK